MLRAVPEDQPLHIRAQGDATLPVLVYLPGLHGDWTLANGLRQALAGRVRFVDFLYPSRTDWGLAQYADGIEAALLGQGVEQGWLLAESFGSQVAWAILARARKFHAEGLILAGGFVRHPMNLGVRLAAWGNRHAPFFLIRALLVLYGLGFQLCFRPDPEQAAGLNEFLARRTREDRRALIHRYGLIAGNDPREIARQVNLPVYYLTGLADPIVPWPLVRAWLKRHCLTYRGWRLVWRAEHAVLASAPRQSARQILAWMGTGIPLPR
jgi:pimeloyl-ACP methyl ester carboxylesterase